MPTYEYLREDGSKFEISQGINDEPLNECPTTGQKVKRIISGGAGVVYKGEGFYVNDYKKDGKKASSNGNGDSKKTEEKSETSSKENTADKKNNE